MSCILTPRPPFQPNLSAAVNMLSLLAEKSRQSERELVEEVIDVLGESLQPLRTLLCGADERTALVSFYTTPFVSMLDSQHDASTSHRPFIGLAKTLDGVRFYVHAAWWERSGEFVTSQSATWLLDPYTLKFKEGTVATLGGRMDRLKDDEVQAFVVAAFPHHIPVWDGVNELALGFLPKKTGPVLRAREWEALRANLLAERVETGRDREVIALILSRLNVQVAKVVPKGSYKAEEILTLTLSGGCESVTTSSGIAPLSILVNRYGLLRNADLPKT